MASGNAVVAAIERRLATLRRDSETLDEQFRRARAELAAVQRAQLDAFTRLARLRMHEIAGGELLQGLDDADRRVAELLQIRAAAEESLRHRLASAERELAAAKSERSQLQPAVDAAADAAATAVRDRDARLEASATYAAKLAAARAAEAIAEHAETKAQVAEADRLAKTAAYDADPVFAYLWGRGYGTPAYSASPAVRTLDAWVARGSGYDALRRDYWLLQEIPVRLAEHARRMRIAAEESLAAARALETEAADAAGVPAAQRALAEAEQRLAEIDRAIETHAAAVTAQTQERERFAAGEDEHSMRCAALLAEALQRVDAHDLRKRAVRTSSDEDDRLLDELERLDQDHARHQQELIRVRRLHQAQRERTLGLEEVRRQFERADVSGAPTRLANEPLVEVLLDRFVAGAVGVDELADGLRRQQRRLG